MIRIRRIYEPETPGEHYKVLIDRLWPRGISKEKAGWDEWMKEVAPSNELRKWYNHDHARWDEFRQRYEKELSSRKDDLRKLKRLEEAHGTLTMLTSTKEAEFNHAVALRDYLMRTDN
jgi:uncharacterized protein YeaO (DUF488 family)